MNSNSVVPHEVRKCFPRDFFVHPGCVRIGYFMHWGLILKCNLANGFHNVCNLMTLDECVIR